MPGARILIVQPYVPSYRVPLFAQLDDLLTAGGDRLLVAAGRPQGADAARQDAVEGRPWMTQLEQSTVRLGGRSLPRRLVGPTLQQYRPTHVIVEQALHNLDTYEIWNWARRSRASMATWGHGRTYTATTSRAQEAAKAWLTRRASWFFAYTQGGADYVRAHGFPAGRITVLGNSTDTRTLQHELAAVADADLEAFRTRLGLVPGRVALFLGGLDDRKGLPFLLESARRVAAEVPGFVLLLGGEGDRAADLRREQQAGAPIRVLGRLDGADRALALRSASVIAIPEWVGLVAVDALAAGIPVVTTTHHRHAPEFEYLRPDANAVVTAHTVADYARGIRGLLDDPARCAALGRQGLADAAGLSIEQMAGRFAGGIAAWTGGGA